MKKIMLIFALSGAVMVGTTSCGNDSEKSSTEQPADKHSHDHLESNTHTQDSAHHEGDAHSHDSTHHEGHEHTH